MITIRTGNYTQTEKENLSDLFCFLSDHVCSYCDAITRDVSDSKCLRCQFKHIISDMCRVDSPKKNDNSVT